MSIGIKDVLHVDGMPTAAGADGACFGGAQGLMVGRLLSQGAIIIGKSIGNLAVQPFDIATAVIDKTFLGIEFDGVVQIIIGAVNVPVFTTDFASPCPCERIVRAHPDARIVMVSSVGYQENIVAALQKGARHFVQKPVKAEILYEVIKYVMGDDAIMATPAAREN